MGHSAQSLLRPRLPTQAGVTMGGELLGNDREGATKKPSCSPPPLPCLHFMIRLQSAGAADDDYVPIRVFILGGRVVRPKNVSTVHRIARNAPDRSKQGQLWPLEISRTKKKSAG